MADPGSARILVVDDEPMNREVLQRRLARHGFEVETADSGRTALRMLTCAQYDAIVLDIMMPDMTGLEVLIKIRATPSLEGIPVIMATALTDSETMIEAFGLGADDFVTKPIDMPVLMARLGSRLRRATASIPPRSETPAGPGTVLRGKYRLADPIGYGSFGVVYRAHHITLDTPVAVKVLHMRFAEMPKVVVGFRTEGVLACRVRDPHAVSMIDSDVSESGQPFLVMELLRGASVRELMDDVDPMPLLVVAEIVRGVCHALTTAHAQNIVHLDIKPANVFVTNKDGTQIVKVVDFGIAKLVDPATDPDREKKIVGTVEYMSLSRLLGKKAYASCDVFSLAVTVYELLTNVRPFLGNDPTVLGKRQIAADFTPLNILNPKVPRAIARLIAAGLSTKASERPTPREFAERFDKAAKKIFRPGPDLADFVERRGGLDRT